MPASGKGNVTVDGVLYPFWRQDGGMLAGARFDAAINGHTDFIRGDLDAMPTLTEEDEDTAGNELRTGLEVAGETFPLAELLGAGTSTQDGDNFVAEARTELEKISGQVDTLIDLFKDADGGQTTLNGLIGTTNQIGKWGEAQAAVDKVFGGTVTLRAEADADEADEAFDDLVQALSSLDAFQAATEKDGEGVFEDAELTADQAADAFDATESQATAALGMLGDTRFGAVVLKERANARGKLGYDYKAADGQNLTHNRYAADVLVTVNNNGVVTGRVTELVVEPSDNGGGQIGSLVFNAAEDTDNIPTHGGAVTGSYVTVPDFSDAANSADRVAAVQSLVQLVATEAATVAGLPTTKPPQVTVVERVGVGPLASPYWYQVDLTVYGNGSTERTAQLDLGVVHVTGASTGGAVSEGAGELGAFAYATIDDTVRTNHIQTSGNAYYEGATRAVGGDATLYSGDFEMQVRFRSKKVSGLVSNLRDSDGATWQFKYGDVDSIILPEANLGTQANWDAKSTPASDDDPIVNGAQITFAPRAGSPSPVTVIGGFQGTLLGTGAAAGEQAVGTWSVGADPGEKGGYLAGGFGAARVADTPTTLPASDDGTMTETMVSPVTGQTLADGMLKLVGTKRGADEAVGVTRTKEDKVEISLATMFGKQDANSWTNGAKQVDLARAEIERLMSQLNAFIALDNDDATEADTLLANKNRAEIWASVNTTIERYLFNNDTEVLDETDSANVTAANWGDMLNKGYPVSSGGNALDAEALSKIQEVLDALASQAALGDAIEEDGIFKGLNLKADGATETVANTWDRKESRVQWRLSSTEYTRFGVWRKQNNNYASDGEGANNKDDADGPGRFAYSPLAQTSYTSHLDPSYPDGGVATYTGETLAIQNADFYMGTIAVRVEWAAGSVGGKLAAVISDLENVGNGDPLLYAPTDANPAYAIREIIFAANVDEVLSFEDNAGADITYFAAAGGLTTVLKTAKTNTASLQGKFVGQDIDGPLGVIGTWTLKKGAGATSKIGNNAHTIHGAFGAEVGP